MSRIFTADYSFSELLFFVASRMEYVKHFVSFILLIPVVVGAAYGILSLVAIFVHRNQFRRAPTQRFRQWPAVSLLKPVCGLEKNLRYNLRSACLQDYPEFQVVFSVQDECDPALPILKELQEEFSSARITVAIEDCLIGTNGKVTNLAGGLRHATHEFLVISDSDVQLPADYLKTIIAPLADESVGCVCTLYKAARADSWFEKLELLTLNIDFIPNVVFADVTRASMVCLGASTALRRPTLDHIGGLEALADYLVEDYEMGRRVWKSGKQVVTVPYLVDTMVDLKTPSQWWTHQVYWDQNTRAARPWAFLSTGLIRSVPFALIFASFRLFDPLGIIVLLGALSLRLITSAFILKWGLRDTEGLKALHLLPLRDILALASWVSAFTQRTTTWRGAEFTLTRDGRLVAKESGS